MARLRNRIRKADYFSDGQLLRWPRDKRTTYSGLYALAEDSGCLEDDVFTWKVLLWPGPLDGDITVDILTQWRDELVAEGKLIEYRANGTPCLFLRSFHRHEHPRNPQPPDLPLPAWVCYQQVTAKRGAGEFTRNVYVVDDAAIPSADGSVSSLKRPTEQPPTATERPSLDTTAVQQPNGDGTVGLTSPLSSPVQSSPVPKRAPAREAPVETVDNSRAGKPSGQKKKTRPDLTPAGLPLPDVPDAITGPIAKIVGGRVGDLLDPGSDLNLQCRRLLEAVDQLAQKAFGRGVTVAQRDQARLLAFRQLVKTHQKKPIQNLPAYIETMLKNDWHLGDLVGDRWVEEQRHQTRPKQTGEAKKLGDVLPQP